MKLMCTAVHRICLCAKGIYMYMMRVSSLFPSTVINGEKASYCTPTFSEKRNRTLSLLLKDVEHRCTTEVGSATLTHVYIHAGVSVHCMHV